MSTGPTPVAPYNTMAEVEAALRARVGDPATATLEDALRHLNDLMAVAAANVESEAPHGGSSWEFAVEQHQALRIAEAGIVNALHR